MTSPLLISRILVIRSASTSLASRLYPLRVPAETALESLVGIGVLATGSDFAVDDVFGTELADVVCDAGDDVATKLLVLTEILALESEFVLLGHVASSKCADLVHDMEENSFGSALALGGVL